jgi:hypothetical protein
VQRLAEVHESDLVVAIAKQSAKELLARDFTPQGMKRTALIAKLEDDFKQQPVGEALEKLVASGIMVDEPVGGEAHLYFKYDPVAEFLASMTFCEEYATQDLFAWNSFMERLNNVKARAAGFVAALQISLASYRTKLQLPAFMKID